MVVEPLDRRRLDGGERVAAEPVAFTGVFVPLDGQTSVDHRVACRTAYPNGTVVSRVPWWKITPASPASTYAGLRVPAIDIAPHTAEENSGFDPVTGSFQRTVAPADIIAPAE